MTKTSVLVADDEATIRSAIIDLIESDNELTVIGEASDALTAVEVARTTLPDVALIDVKMPNGGGPSAARGIRLQSPSTKIVALTAYEDLPSVLEMLRAGAMGYMVKGSGSDLRKTIRYVAQGQAVLSRSVTANVIAALVAALEKVEEAARLKDQAANVRSEIVQLLAHEIRTPVTILSGAAQSIAAKHRTMPEETLEALRQSVTRATQRLNRLATNVAAVVQASTDVALGEARILTTIELLERLEKEFKSDWTRIEVNLSEDIHQMQILGDPDLLTRPFVVVLENALSFSSPDTRVSLEASIQGHDLKVRITDRGEGVKEEMQESIFDLFGQVDSSTTRHHEGLGLGLHLARRILERHNGSIELESSDQLGSVFSIRLPVLPVD